MCARSTLVGHKEKNEKQFYFDKGVMKQIDEKYNDYIKNNKRDDLQFKRQNKNFEERMKTDQVERLYEYYSKKLPTIKTDFDDWIVPTENFLIEEAKVINGELQDVYIYYVPLKLHWSLYSWLFEDILEFEANVYTFTDTMAMVYPPTHETLTEEAIEAIKEKGYQKMNTERASGIHMKSNISKEILSVKIQRRDKLNVNEAATNRKERENRIVSVDKTKCKDMKLQKNDIEI